MPDKKIDLKTGCPSSTYPDINPASFSRFVLPFSYSIEVAERTAEKELYYKTKTLEGLPFTKRRRYFTRETALTLYERAIWLEMCDNWKATLWGQEEVEITLINGTFKMGMCSPQITLLEALVQGENDPFSTLAHPDNQANPLHTGFLYVDVYFSNRNDNQPQLDDLLVLNEFFRYSTIRDNAHVTPFNKYLGEIPVDYSVEKTKIPRRIKDLENNLARYFDRWANLLEIPIYHNERCYNLFSREDAKHARNYVNKLENDDAGWYIYDDNRTYTWTGAFIEGGARALKECFEGKSETLNATEYGHWLRLMNIDPPVFDFSSKQYAPPEVTDKSITCFDKQWIEENTYKRWEESGTWYGFTYHSGAVLAAPLPYVFEPFHSYYFDSNLLLFYLRISLFRFSNELTRIFSTDPQSRQCRNKIKRLRKQFSLFTILYQFPLVSNQQQSIEMYEAARESLRVDAFFKEIETEINNTHDYLEMIENANLSQSAHKLAKYGLPIAVAGTTAAVMSMTDLSIVKCLSNWGFCKSNFGYWLQIGLVVSLTAIATFLLARDKGEKK